jgi:AAA15 family ATPase/GTPase
MTVTAVRFENFMGFAEDPDENNWIELRPIGLLFGRNSSGKSALFRALRLLKQSLNFGTEKEPLVFVVEEGLDLGGFNIAVHNQEVERTITFHFRIDSPSITDIVLPLRNFKQEVENLNPI